MQSAPSVFARPDTFFGVCEAIGQDFGFNSNYLRIAFGVTVLLSPVIVLGTYAVLGAIVALSRWIYPSRAVGEAVPAHIDAPVSPAAENDESAIAFAIAA